MTFKTHAITSCLKFTSWGPLSTPCWGVEDPEFLFIHPVPLRELQRFQLSIDALKSYGTVPGLLGHPVETVFL